MNGDWKLIGFGGAVIAAGVAMAVAQMRAVRGSRALPLDDPDEYERQYVHRRSRRRLQTSLLLTTVGLLMALHPWVVPDPKAAPRLFAAWWLSALLLAGGIILLSLLDMLATRAHARVQIARLHLKQRELRRQFDDLRSEGADGTGDF